MAKAKPFTPPKNLAVCADLLYTTRNERLALQKSVEALEKKESAIREYIIDNLPKSKADGIQGKLVRVSIEKKQKAVIKDYDKFYAYVKKHNAFELLQKRLNEAAVKERWENKKEVPGVDKFTVVTLSVNKV